MKILNEREGVIVQMFLQMLKFFACYLFVPSMYHVLHDLSTLEKDTCPCICLRNNKKNNNRFIYSNWKWLCTSAPTPSTIINTLTLEISLNEATGNKNNLLNLVCQQIRVKEWLTDGHEYYNCQVQKKYWIQKAQ